MWENAGLETSKGVLDLETYRTRPFCPHLGLEDVWAMVNGQRTVMLRLSRLRYLKMELGRLGTECVSPEYGSSGLEQRAEGRASSQVEPHPSAQELRVGSHKEGEASFSTHLLLDNIYLGGSEAQKGPDPGPCLAGIAVAKTVVSL